MNIIEFANGRSYFIDSNCELCGLRRVPCTVVNVGVTDVDIVVACADCERHSTDVHMIDVDQDRGDYAM
jgi:hypothetical protein